MLVPASQASGIVGEDQAEGYIEHGHEYFQFEPRGRIDIFLIYGHADIVRVADIIEKDKGKLLGQGYGVFKVK